MKKLGSTFIVVLFVFQAFAQENKEIKDYSEAFKLVEVWLDAQKDYEQLPGISAAVVKDQQIKITYIKQFENYSVKIDR